MTLGPGKYDPVCTLVRTLTSAQAVVLMVLGGELGEGFSVQCSAAIPPKVLATALRNVADVIEKEAL